MNRRLLYFVAASGLLWQASVSAQTPSPSANAPVYDSTGVVNAATQLAGPLAGNTIITIYGTNLADQALSAAGSLSLPTQLGSTFVLIGGSFAPLFYVSPTQVNALIPYGQSGTISLYVLHGALHGPQIMLQLDPASPGMFTWTGGVIAQHSDGSVISATAPARAGETIVLYATGLGRIVPDLVQTSIASRAAPIAAASQMTVLLNGVQVPASAILYAGVTPGTAGLYQINLTLPTPLAYNPEIRVQIGSDISPAGVFLATASMPQAAQ